MARHHPEVKRAIGLSGDLLAGARAAIRTSSEERGGVDFRVVSATLTGWTFRCAIQRIGLSDRS
jgi:hypothetical protein